MKNVPMVMVLLVSFSFLIGCNDSPTSSNGDPIWGNWRVVETQPISYWSSSQSYSTIDEYLCNVEFFPDGRMNAKKHDWDRGVLSDDSIEYAGRLLKYEIRSDSLHIDYSDWLTAQGYQYDPRWAVDTLRFRISSNVLALCRINHGTIIDSISYHYAKQ